MFKTNVTWGEFRKELLESHNIKFKYVVKSESAIQRFIGWFMAFFGINKTYMTEFYTIIGNTIAVPSRDALPGEDDEFMTDKELRTYSHERVHIFQRRRDGAIKFYLRYAFSAKWRAKYEEEAYGTSMFVDWKLGADVYAWPYHVLETLDENYRIKRKLAKEVGGRLIELANHFEMSNFVRDIDEDLAALMDSKA